MHKISLPVMEKKPSFLGAFISKDIKQFLSRKAQAVHERYATALAR